MEDEKYRILRERMVAGQLKARGVANSNLLRAFTRVPRHLFVGDSERHLAYRDHPITIGEKQTISQPYIIALMTEVLQLKGEEKVLEIGTGSGYQAAILAELAREVYTVERIPSLQERAREVLLRLGYTNIHFKTGDGTKGWPEEAPFNGIIVTAAAGKIPSALLEQLAPAGSMVIPVGCGWVQELMLITRGRSGFQEQNLGECRFVPLISHNGCNSGTDR